MGEDDSPKAKPRLPSWAKALAILAPIVGSGYGAYRAAREEGRKDSQAGYEMLAPTVAKIGQAVDDLAENQRRQWEFELAMHGGRGREPRSGELPSAPDTVPSPSPHPVLRPLSRPASGGGGGLSGLRGNGNLSGAGSAGAGAGGEGSIDLGVLGTGTHRLPTHRPIVLGSGAPLNLRTPDAGAPLPKLGEQKAIGKIDLPPPTFGEAVNRWEQSQEPGPRAGVKR
jgi:hypothetical protein